MIVLAQVCQPETLMYRVVRVFALSAVLWHITFGCCLHHVHAHALVDGGDCAGAGVGTADRHAGHHADHDAACQCAHGDASSHGCCGGERCSFVRPEPEGNLEISLERHLVAVALPAMDSAGEASPTMADAIANDRAACPGPLRLYLANQVLLI